MNYERIYYAIIENRRNNPYDGYTEKHHILPKSLGGSNKKDNLVRLSGKEHFICHLLLTKMYEKGTNEYYKMLHAFMCMKNGIHSGRYKTSRNYEHLKIEYSKIMSEHQTGDKNSHYGMQWIYNIELQECIRIKNGNLLESGWLIGRIIDWNSHYSNRKCFICDNIGCMSKMSKYCSKSCRDIMNNFGKLESDSMFLQNYTPLYSDMLTENKNKHRLKEEYYCRLYSLYNELGFTEFVKKTGYDKTQAALIYHFKKHVSTFDTTSETGKFKISEDAKERSRQKSLGRKLSDEAKQRISDNNKLTNESRIIKLKEVMTGLKNINNGTVNKRVKENELDDYLSNGWSLGYFKK